jgi:hypothetical protein
MINATAIHAQRLQAPAADTVPVPKGPAARAADAKPQAMPKDKVTLSVLKKDFMGLSSQHKAIVTGVGIGLLTGAVGMFIDRGNGASGHLIAGALTGGFVAGTGARTVRNFTEGSWGNKIASGLALTGTTALGVSIAKQATNMTLATQIKGGVWGLAVGTVVVGATTGLLRAMNK